MGHSDEHDAEHGARSGNWQLLARSKTTKPGASSNNVNLGRTGPVCERNEMEEHRTGGGADGMEWRRTVRAVIAISCYQRERPVLTFDTFTLHGDIPLRIAIVR